MKPYNQVKKEQKEAMDKLLEFAGTQKRLADALGAPPTTVSGWVSRGRISATMAIVAERVTSGEITKEELRPDIESWSADNV